VAGQLVQTPRRQVAGDVGVAAAVREPRGQKRLLRTTQRGVGGAPLQRAAVGVGEIFQQERVPVRQRARPRPPAPARCRRNSGFGWASVARRSKVKRQRDRSRGVTRRSPPRYAPARASDTKSSTSSRTVSGSAGAGARRGGRAVPSPAGSTSMRSRTFAVPRQ